MMDCSCVDRTLHIGGVLQSRRRDRGNGAAHREGSRVCPGDTGAGENRSIIDIPDLRVSRYADCGKPRGFERVRGPGCGESDPIWQYGGADEAIFR